MGNLGDEGEAVHERAKGTRAGSGKDLATQRQPLQPAYAAS